MTTEMITLNNGHTMPRVGLGTAHTSSPEEIRTALDMGYRHIDTAYYYENEELVGNVLHEYFTSGKLKREYLFITSKMWPTFHSGGKISLALENSLKKLRLNYMDLYLDHFPPAHQVTGEGEDRVYVFEDVKLEEVWKAMEELVRKGKAKSIGVSNYNMEQVQRILKIAEIKPVINQTKKGEPIVLDDPVARQIATKHNRTVAQILLRYTVQRGGVVIPASSNPDWQRDNMNIFHFELDDGDMVQLAAQDKKMRFLNVIAFKDHPDYPFNEPL